VGGTDAGAVDGETRRVEAAGAASLRKLSELPLKIRAWLVAYGVGAPVLFLSRDPVMNALKAEPDAQFVILAYLVGSFLQVLLVWLYKLSMWWAYLEEMNTIAKGSVRYKFVDWFTNTFWVEGLIDFLSVALFGYATTRILLVLAA
jgi:hypothetical protein